MITLDTFFVIVLAAMLAGALVAVLPTWRGMHAAHKLPIRGFLKHRSAGLDRVAALQAELRCESCSAKVRCRDLLAAGAREPVAGCPNRELFRRTAPAHGEIGASGPA